MKKLERVFVGLYAVVLFFGLAIEAYAQLAG